MRYGFEPENEDIRRFSTYKAVEFFRKLLWAEASDTEIIQSSTHVPQRFYVKDGGIDAKVVDASPIKGRSHPIRNIGLSNHQTSNHENVERR